MENNFAGKQTNYPDSEPNSLCSNH